MDLGNFWIEFAAVVGFGVLGSLLLLLLFAIGCIFKEGLRHIRGL